MRKVIVGSTVLGTALLACIFWLRAQSQSSEPQYAMTTYYVGFLYRGPEWTPQPTPELEQLQKDHLAHIRRMADSGKLLLAGPFMDDTDLRGMLVFQTATLEEARAMAEDAPAVKAGRLKVELHPWFSAKGIRVDLTPKGQ